LISEPDGSIAGGASPCAIAGAAIGVVVFCVASVALVLRLCRRRRHSKLELVSESPPEPPTAEPATAYTLSVEDGHEIISDYDEFAHIDARPPVTEESDGALFPGDEPPTEEARAWLPWRHQFARGGQQAVMMRSLLSQF
jgi:hypothetical protein